MCVGCIDTLVLSQCKNLECFVGSDKKIVCTGCATAHSETVLAPHLSPETSAALGYARANTADPDVPPELLCPINYLMMAEPIAIAGTTHCFEKGAIEYWFRNHSTSPMTGLKVAKKLEFNDATREIKARIESWRAAESQRREFFGLEILPPLTPFVMSAAPADFARLGASIAATMEALLTEAPDEAALLAAVQSIRRLLSIPNPPAEELLQYARGSDVIPRLVEIVATRADAQMLRFEAAWALTNIASGPTAHCNLVLLHGAVPVLVEALKCPFLDVVEQCAWALGNISGDSFEARDECLDASGMMTLVQVWKSTVDANGRVPKVEGGAFNHSFVNTLTWTLSNFCRAYRGNKPRLEQVAPGLPMVADALAYLHQPNFSPVDVEAVSNACWALNHITHISNNAIEVVLAVPGLAASIVACARQSEPSLSKPILRTIGNIISGENHQAQVLIELGVIPLLFDIFKRESRAELRKDLAWTFSNITAGSADQIQTLITSSGGAIVPHLLDAAVDCRDAPLQKELLWTIANLSSSGNLSQMAYLVSLDVLPKLCAIFNSSKHMSDVLRLVGETIYNILNAVNSAKEEDLRKIDGITTLVSLLASEKQMVLLNSVYSPTSIASLGNLDSSGSPSSSSGSSGSSGGGGGGTLPATLRQKILQQLDFRPYYDYLMETHSQLSQRGEQILRVYQELHLSEHAKDRPAAPRPQHESLVFSTLSAE